jgi:hypothetical protein
MGATLTEISKRWRVPVYITLYTPVCANQCILAPNARIAFSALIARRHYYYFQTNLVISQLVKKKIRVLQAYSNAYFLLTSSRMGKYKTIPFQVLIRGYQLGGFNWGVLIRDIDLKRARKFSD